MAEQQKLSIKERWRKACTADNIVDFTVDVFLIVFDVLSSPILIVMVIKSCDNARSCIVLWRDIWHT